MRIVAHARSFRQKVIAGPFDRRRVHKHGRATFVGNNEAIPFASLNHFAVPVATSAFPFLNGPAIRAANTEIRKEARPGHARRFLSAAFEVF
jgi:hypothetical protein